MITTPVNAEGGEGSSVILPEAVVIEASQAAEAQPEAAAIEATEASPPSKKTAKADKDPARKTAKASASSPAQGDEAQAAAAGAVAKAKEQDAEQTSALELIKPDARMRPRQADAVRANALKPLIAQYASENDVPFGLADAVVRIESRYNANARNGVNLGLTQVNFRTAQSLGYKGDASGLLDAETNLRYGLKYLAMAHRLAGGDTCGTILRYQFGLRTQTMTSASRAYCSKVKTIIATAE
ncbi:lytic transglycosylase [Microvirga aerophila]|uniref:Lytic transglycosylase n=1 Tax=Microvirga aerophila TaxID=670291 RepID=A0A512BLI7_9HYPH|nr:lytic transglycosylase [Microvirga aerophila]